MKKTNRIRIFSILFVVCILVAARLVFPAPQTKDSPKKSTDNKAEKQKDASDYSDKKVSEKEAVKESLNAERNYEYVIVAEDGYLTVYLSDLKTVFEYTDIQFEELDDVIRDKISNGYCIQNLEELYNFLENYSS